jgi:hypothetical protein
VGGAVTEMVTVGEGLVARVLRRTTRERREEAEGEVLLGPERADHITPDRSRMGEALVLPSGNLGLVYLTADTERMSLERIGELYPELVPTLVDHPGIGFLLVRSADGEPIVFGRDGMLLPARGEVRGADPLASFGPSARRQVLRTHSFPHCADLMVNSLWDAQTEEVAAFEHLVGSHGGLGGEQTHPFVLFPADLPCPPQPVHGAEELHRVFRGWLAHLGHAAFAPGAQVPVSKEPG